MVDFVLLVEEGFDDGGGGDKDGVVGGVEVEAAEVGAGLVEKLEFVLEELLFIEYIHVNILFAL